MTNRQKDGVSARIGLFLAIAAMFGQKEMRRVGDYRRATRGRLRKIRKDTGGASGPHRSGFKLAKRMYRRPGVPGFGKIAKHGQRRKIGRKIAHAMRVSQERAQRIAAYRRGW